MDNDKIEFILNIFFRCVIIVSAVYFIYYCFTFT
jgi:hypothetical protein